MGTSDRIWNRVGATSGIAAMVITQVRNRQAPRGGTRMMTKLAILTVGVVIALTSALAASAQTVATGDALQHPIGQSGIVGHIHFVDNGPTGGLVVTGTANGLDPSRIYISLIYNTGSVPGGRAACEPTFPPGKPGSPLTDAQMFAGVWQVAPDGTGNLVEFKLLGFDPATGIPILEPGVKTGPFYAALGTFSTVSIRIVPDFTVKACGEVHTNPA